MIITCERCATKFQLADDRVPAEGVRVRCSRCKHAFFVAPADPSSEDAVHRRASEAIAAAATSGAPPATADLGDSGARRRKDGGDTDPDWEFNEDPVESEELTAAREAVDDLLRPPPPPTPSLREPEPAPAPPAPSVQAPSLEREPGPIEREFVEDLGSPDEWDFFGEEADAAQAPVDLRSARTRRGDAARIDATIDALTQGPVALDGEDETAAPWRARGAQAAGWACVVVLFAAGVTGGLLREAPEAHAVAPPRFGDLQVAAVEGRFVDNAVAGELYVVAGRLENTGRADAVLGGEVVVQLLDGAGDAIATATAGPAIGVAQLRESDPSGLLAEQRAASHAQAWLPFDPGERRRFEALFTALPPTATHFRINHQPTAEPPPPPLEALDEATPEAEAAPTTSPAP